MVHRCAALAPFFRDCVTQLCHCLAEWTDALFCSDVSNLEKVLTAAVISSMLAAGLQARSMAKRPAQPSLGLSIACHAHRLPVEDRSAMPRSAVLARSTRVGCCWLGLAWRAWSSLQVSAWHVAQKQAAMPYPPGMSKEAAVSLGCPSRGRVVKLGGAALPRYACPCQVDLMVRGAGIRAP